LAEIREQAAASLRSCGTRSGKERGEIVPVIGAIRRAPCPVTSHLGNSQVIGNQGRHPFVVQAGQKSSREVTGRNARTKSGGFSPLNGERAGVRGENTHCWALAKSDAPVRLCHPR